MALSKSGPVCLKKARASKYKAFYPRLAASAPCNKQQSANKFAVANCKFVPTAFGCRYKQQRTKCSSLYILRTRAAAGTGSACGVGASPAPGLRESARAVLARRVYFFLVFFLGPTSPLGLSFFLNIHAKYLSARGLGASPAPDLRESARAVPTYVNTLYSISTATEQ